MKEKSLSSKAVKDYSINPIPDYYWDYDVRSAVFRLKETLIKKFATSHYDKTLIRKAIDEIFGKEKGGAE